VKVHAGLLRHSTSVWEQDVHFVVRAVGHSPQFRRCVECQHTVSCQYRAPEARTVRHRSSSDQIDPERRALDQPAATQVGEVPVADPGVAQLAAGYDAVLASRKFVPSHA